MQNTMVVGSGEDPDLGTFVLPDPGSCSSDPTYNNGYIKIFPSWTEYLNQNQQFQASTKNFHWGKFL